MSTPTPSWFDRWLWSFRTPTEGLALYRVLFAGYVLVTGVPMVSWAGRLPPAFFDPPDYSLGMFFSSMPSEGFLSALSVALVALYVMLLFGWHTRAVSLALTAVLGVGLTFHYSFGKIDHGEVFLLVVPFILAFSPWGEAYSLDAARRRGGEAETVRSPLRKAWPVALVAVVIALAYASAGLQKLPWLDLDLTTHGARRWLIDGYQRQGRTDLLAGFFYGIRNPYMWEVMDVTAVVFEVGFAVALLRGTWFRVWAAVAIGFHAANYFILNISFTHLVVIYALFLPWSLDMRVLRDTSFVDRLESFLTSKAAFLVAVAVYPATCALALAAFPDYRPLNFHPVIDVLSFIVPGDFRLDILINLALSAVVGVAFVAPVVGRIRRRSAARAVAS